MCTNLMLSVPSIPGEDSPPIHVSSRCMEMPGVIEQSLYVMAQGQEFPLWSAPFVPAEQVHEWTSEIDFVGISPSGETWASTPNFCDGINSAGLSVGALWLEPGTDYPLPAQTAGPQVTFLDFPAWVLGTCSVVGDVTAALVPSDGGQPAFTVVGPSGDREQPDSEYFRPLHYIVTDATGASVIVEFSGGETQTYSSDNAVMTNAPTYDWQLTNVRNYDNVSLVGHATSVTGSGPPVGGSLLGLPGDSLSASRFIRAWYLSQGFAQLPADGRGWLPAPGGFDPGKHDPPGFAESDQTAVVVALQLVQICMGTPYGMLLERREDHLGPKVGDYTMWTGVRDHTNVVYYFMSAFSGILTKIALADVDFAGAAAYPHSPSVPVLPQAGLPWCVDATSMLASADAP
ncbi:MAG TPA: linear amide C-N hydrolase [Solirubrobacteraceae bacterium]